MPVKPSYLDVEILKQVDWESLVNAYKKDSKEIYCLNKSSRVCADAYNLLLYVRAFTRVYVDVFANKYKKEHPDMEFIIAGSTNVTSDYDVTVVGPRSYHFVKEIMHGFYKEFHKQLPLVADTNLYIAPAFLYNSKYSRNYPSWLKRTCISDKAESVTQQTSTCFPLPASPIAIAQDRAVVRKKWNMIREHQTPLSSSQIMERYNKLISIGRKLDKFFYTSHKHSTKSKSSASTSALTEQEFWKLITSANQTSMESYHAISTVIIIVAEIQMKKDIKDLRPEHYMIAAMENYVDLLIHMGPSPSTSSPMMYVKTSKYVYRIIYCLERARTLSTSPTNPQAMFSQSQTSFVDYIVSQRGNPEFKPSHAHTNKMKKIHSTLSSYFEPKFNKL